MTRDRLPTDPDEMMVRDVIDIYGPYTIIRIDDTVQTFNTETSSWDYTPHQDRLLTISHDFFIPSGCVRCLDSGGEQVIIPYNAVVKVEKTVSEMIREVFERLGG